MDNEKIINVEILKEISNDINKMCKTFYFGENNGFSNLMIFANHMGSKIVIIPKKNEDQIPESFTKSRLPGMETNIYSNEANPIIFIGNKIEDPFIVFYSLDKPIILKIENCF